MKIKNINKETKNTKKKFLLPIAKAGLSLGLTTALIKTGMIDYDAMLNWENVSDILNNMNMGNLPGVDINTIFDLVKTAVTTFGMNTIMIASKGLIFTKEVIKPLLENEKVKTNPTVLKIKEIFKGKNKEKEDKKPKALGNLAKNGLSLGFKVYMIASGQIDYNSVYDFTKLPHKFAQIAQIAENIDLNKVKIGMKTLKILPEFISERKEEKQEGMPLIPPISFKDIFAKTSKEFPLSANVTDLTCVESMTQNQSKPIIREELEEK